MTLTIELEDEWNSTYQRALAEQPEAIPLELADQLRRWMQGKKGQQAAQDAQWAMQAYGMLPSDKQAEVTTILETVLPRT